MPRTKTKNPESEFGPGEIEFEFETSVTAAERMREAENVLNAIADAPQLVLDEETNSIGAIILETDDGDVVVKWSDGSTSTESADDVTELKQNGIGSRINRILKRRSAANALRKSLRLEAAAERAKEKAKEKLAAVKNPADWTVEDELEKIIGRITKHDFELNAFYNKGLQESGVRPNEARKLEKSTPRDEQFAYVVAHERKSLQRAFEFQSKPENDIWKNFGETKANPAAWQIIGNLANAGVAATSAIQLREYYKNRKRAKKNPTVKNPTANQLHQTFQGRPSTNKVELAVSNHAPNKLTQLGDLVELKLMGQKPQNFGRKRNGSKGNKINYPFKLCANPRNNQLWIAGGKIGRSTTKINPNEATVVGEIDHVVYRTTKDHLGDNGEMVHYIHKLGEDSNVRPVLAIDADGYPIIQGGNYVIESRGIVD